MGSRITHACDDLLAQLAGPVVEGGYVDDKVVPLLHNSRAGSQPFHSTLRGSRNAGVGDEWLDTPEYRTGRTNNALFLDGQQHQSAIIC